MEITKELAIAMLAGAYAIRNKLHRDGSTFVLDPFNKQGFKSTMKFSDAEQLLYEAAYDVLFAELPESENEKYDRAGDDAESEDDAE